jgi:NitT/TauT family transport system permease protein
MDDTLDDRSGLKIRRLGKPNRIQLPSGRSWVSVFALLVIVVLWQLVVLAAIYPTFIIPAPLDVLDKFIEVVLDRTLFVHVGTTLSSVLVGLAIGVLSATILGYAIAKTPILEDALSPLIVAIQSTPVVAYAPLLVIWFGSGLTSKIVTSALIVFFPMLMNTIVGLRGVSPALRDLMHSLEATRWQMFTHLELPAAMPVLLGGLKISATLAVIGAVVGEFISANAGLGYLINIGRSQYDTPLVIVAVLTLTGIARLLYGMVSILEGKVLAWQHREHRSNGV